MEVFRKMDIIKDACEKRAAVIIQRAYRYYRLKMLCHDFPRGLVISLDAAISIQIAWRGYCLKKEKLFYAI